MKHLLIIFSLLLTSVSWCEDYLMDNNGKRTIVTEHNYTNKSSFRAFKIEGKTCLIAYSIISSDLIKGYLISKMVC